jgi:hypothetical protein
VARGAGEPISNNDPGHPDVRVVGRARPGATSKPIQRSMKSKIVPEPDQIQSPPPPQHRA